MTQSKSIPSVHSHGLMVVLVCAALEIFCAGMAPGIQPREQCRVIGINVQHKRVMTESKCSRSGCFNT